MIHQSPDSEDLFSARPVGAVFETRTKQMRDEIDRMDPDVLLASDPEALAERLAGQYQVGVPQLLRDQMFMDPLEEVDLRPVGGFTAETAEMYAAGQRAMKATGVTVHLPFEGRRHRFVFNMRPTTRRTARPPRVHKIEDDELIVVFATTETDPDRIVSHLNRTVEEIDKYLGWLRGDVSRHNLALLENAREAVAARQERLRGTALLRSASAYPSGVRIPLRPTEYVSNAGRRRSSSP